MDHERDTDIPNWLKWGLTVFNRTGFPALAFFIICYLCFITIKNQTSSIDDFKIVMTHMIESIDRNTDNIQRMTTALYRSK